MEVALTQDEFDALVDFVFNIGPTKFAASRLLHKLNKSDFNGAVAEFGKWSHAGGKVAAGCCGDARRKQRCLNGKWRVRNSMRNLPSPWVDGIYRNWLRRSRHVQGLKPAGLDSPRCGTTEVVP